MSNYQQAGVNIDAAQETVDRFKAAVRSTYTPQVLTDVGSFGGLFALTETTTDSVLVASIDGVGTKVKLAAELGRWQGIGHDIVNHCVNDILVQNARPLFFLDYLATSQLDPMAAAAVVEGIAEACRAVGCALLGGELAEMPGVYTEGSLDVAGAVVGVVERNQILPKPETMAAGDLLIGLPSDGPHTNGYSLIRQLVAGIDLLTTTVADLPLVDHLLAPHRSYLDAVNHLQEAKIPLKGLAHITGGGLIDNLPRILPADLAAAVTCTVESAPPLFQWLVQRGELDPTEAFRVFNMGVGMVVIVDQDRQAEVVQCLPDAQLIGHLVARDRAELQVALVDRNM